MTSNTPVMKNVPGRAEMLALLRERAAGNTPGVQKTPLGIVPLCLSDGPACILG